MNIAKTIAWGIICIVGVSVFLTLLYMHIRMCLTPNYRIVLRYVANLLGNRYAVEKYTLLGWMVIRYDHTVEDAENSIEKMFFNANTKPEIISTYKNGIIEKCK